MLENAKHEKLACALAEGKTQAAAYEIAGYKGRGKSADACVSRLLKTYPEVAARVNEIRGIVTARTEVTLEGLIQMGVDLFNAAAKAEDFTAASSTYERLAKISGHWVDRTASLSVMRLISDRPAKPMDETEWLHQHAPNALRS